MQAQNNKSSGNSFIDDNHDVLLQHMEKLENLVRVGWTADTFTIDVRDFIADIESHFSHEETILKGAKYKALNAHEIRHREIALYLRKESLNDFDHDQAVQFLARARSVIFDHELLEDQEYWHVFEHKKNDDSQLISWSDKLETGDADTDAHHQALVRYINRIHEIFSVSKDIGLATRELRALNEYSKYHFSEEERALGVKLRAAHRQNHEFLISDLNNLIDEVAKGTHKLENAGAYLRYWLLNHVETFDIPAFARGGRKR